MSFPQSVKATLNFAADRNDGGSFSNTGLGITRQKLLPLEVELNNARTLKQPPTLDQQGFTYAAHPRGRAEWSNPDWINAEYVPSCVELVKKLTGAKTVLPLQMTVQRRTDYAEHEGTSPTAGFAHLDLPRDAYTQAATMAADGFGVKFKRAAVYNIWKATTPPPQSQPLTVCDWRTVSDKDFVLGVTAEGDVNVPYVILAPSEQTPPTWYYVPDIGLDESLVFVGGDLDPSHPLGCAHTAFDYPENDGKPRASIEVRVLACFE